MPNIDLLPKVGRIPEELLKLIDKEKDLSSKNIIQSNHYGTGDIVHGNKVTTNNGNPRT